MATTTKPIEVHLDRVRKIRYSNRAIFRMGSLPRSFTLTEAMTGGERGFAALNAWLWCCLEDDDRAAFANPEDLSEILPLHKPERMEEIADRLAETVTAHMDAAGVPKKKAPSKPSSKTRSGRGSN